MTAEDVIKTLAGTPGLKHILGALGYPDATRLEDLNGMREESRRHLKEAMKAARGRMERSNAQGGVGGHIDSALMREYDAVGKPQLNYRSAMRAATLGSGGMLKHAMSEPGDMYSVDPRLMGLSMRRWEGDMIPAEKRRNAFIIMDTSGSVGSDALGMFISELAGLFRYWRDQASKVWLFTGDTAVRGKPQILTPKNYRSVLKNIKAQGGGGTDIDKMIRMVLNNDELMRSGRPKSLMVYSDMMFTPPKRAALPAVIPATYFFYPDTDSYRHAKTWVDRLEKECGTWSKVVPIRKGTTVVLDAPQSAVRRRF